MVGASLYQWADLPGLACAAHLSRPLGPGPLSVTLRTGAESGRVVADDAGVVSGDLRPRRSLGARRFVATAVVGIAVADFSGHLAPGAGRPKRLRRFLQVRASRRTEAVEAPRPNGLPVSAATVGAPDRPRPTRTDVLSAPGNNRLRNPAAVDSEPLDANLPAG